MKNIKTKQEIQNYITKKFLSEGFNKIPVAEISSKVKISKKTIYKNYFNKEEIISEFFKVILNDAYQQLVFLIQSNNRMVEKVERLAEIIKKYLHVFDDESFHNLKREFPSIWFEILVARKRKFIPLLNLLINHSKKHRLIIEFPNELLIKYFSVSLGLLSGKKTLNNFSLSYDKTFNDLFEILLNGILTKKGKKLLAINKRINNENN